MIILGTRGVTNLQGWRIQGAGLWCQGVRFTEEAGLVAKSIQLAHR